MFRVGGGEGDPSRVPLPRDSALHFRADENGTSASTRGAAAGAPTRARIARSVEFGVVAAAA